VLELTYRIRERFKNCSVFWIPASNIESLHQAYAYIAQRLNIPGWDDEKADVKELVQLYLSKESCHGLDKLWKWNVVCLCKYMYE
jgi:hypothetical protein